MDDLPTAQANALRTDLSLVDERVKVGVTTQRSKAMENHDVDPYLSIWEDHILMLQFFG
jgi:hypothetical protein